MSANRIAPDGTPQIAMSNLGLFCLPIPIKRSQGGGSDVVSVSCFGVRFSVMFHFMFVHYTFSSVWVAEWPPFGK